MAMRLGTSRKTRHIDLKFFYMQNLVKLGLVVITKVPGVENVADLGTKYLDAKVLEKLRDIIGLRQGLDVQDAVRHLESFRIPASTPRPAITYYTKPTRTFHTVSCISSSPYFSTTPLTTFHSASTCSAQHTLAPISSVRLEMSTCLYHAFQAWKIIRGLQEGDLERGRL